MKRMLALSVAFHLVLAGVVVGVSARRMVRPPSALQVDLVSLPTVPVRKAPSKPAPPPKPVVQKPEPPKPKARPKPVAKPRVKPEPKVEPLKAKKAAPPREPEKAPPPAPVPAVAEEKSSEPEETGPVPGPSGEAAVQAPSLSSVEAGVDIPNFEFPYYLRIIQGKIGSVWSPPSLGFGNEAREVIVGFVIGPGGAVREVQVEQSSGNIYYDQAAMRAVYMANPMPPLPKGFSDQNLKVHFSFVLAERG